MSNFFTKLLGITLIVVSFASAWLYMDAKQFLNSPLRVGEGGADYTVKAGANLKQIAKTLHEANVVDQPTYLVLLGKWRGGDKVQAGEYFLAPGTTPGQFLDQIIAGKVAQYSLTLVEGWTFEQMLAAVNAHQKLTHTLEGLSPKEVMRRLGWPGQHPEGRFYPDTYRFPGGTSDVDFLRRAYKTMDAYLREHWQNRSDKLPFATAYDALIMASIVEKETALPTERKRIAGVFIRRLEQGMRLQTDPTVIYGLGKAYDGNLRRRDLVADNPYNTYMRKGLPPTPIAMPGKESIDAVLHPQRGKALYFVARKDGSHQFSETLEQHNKAVQNYQLSGR